MTAGSLPFPLPVAAATSARGGRLRRRETAADLPPLSPRLYLVRTALVVALAISGGLVVQLALLSSVQQRAAQQQLFDRFRAELAEGTAPVGPVDAEGALLDVGAPVAFLEIPAIGLRQVVVEGTTSSALFDGPGHRRDTPLPGQPGVSVVDGPGHRRDTPLPGQPGVSVVAGRRAGFGGPFARLDELDEGDTIEVTTGQGRSTYVVMGLRREGDPLPAPLGQREGRLVLATADGRPFLPDGVLRVDAELDGDPQPGSQRALTSETLPSAEEMLGSDQGRLWTLALWLQALVLLSVAAIWAWHRWGRAQAWVVFVPPLALVSLFVANHTAELLPNLL